jgi:hypothetical protein
VSTDTQLGEYTVDLDIRATVSRVATTAWEQTHIRTETVAHGLLLFENGGIQIRMQGNYTEVWNQTFERI